MKKTLQTWGGQNCRHEEELQTRGAESGTAANRRRISVLSSSVMSASSSSLRLLKTLLHSNEAKFCQPERAASPDTSSSSMLVDAVELPAYGRVH